MSTNSPSIEVENVVASMDAGCEIDIETLSTDLEGAEFNPDNFPGLVYRIRDPKVAALVFRSGKVVCTGAGSVGSAEKGASIVFEKLRDSGVDVDDEPDVTIQNMVTSADLGQSLNLNAIAIGVGLEDIEYEPEQFPGLVYRLEDPDVVVLLFGSGKLVVTGGKKPEDAETAVENISEELRGLDLIE